MTVEDFTKEMQTIYEITTGPVSLDGPHWQADELLCKALTDLGYGEGVKIFQNMDKWYA